MVHRRQPLQPLAVILALASLTTIIGQIDAKNDNKNKRNRLRKLGPRGSSTSRILNVRNYYSNKRRLEKHVNETEAAEEPVEEEDDDEEEEGDVVEEPIFDSEDEFVSDGDYDSEDTSGNSTSTTSSGGKGKGGKGGKGKGGKGKGGGASSNKGSKNKGGTSSSTTGGDLFHVNLSIQPAYWAIPIFAAHELGWFTELGLEVDIFVYPSGGPQIMAAVEQEAWDFGMAGSVPNVIAGSQGIATIGISNDESAATEVLAAPGVTDWPPTTLQPGMFASTPSSTGDLLLRECLAQAGVEYTEEHILGGSQDDIIGALEGGDTMYGALWPPNTYSYLADNADAVSVCNGGDVGIPILGGLMVRERWGQENPQIVARLLAAYLRGVTLMLNKKARDMTMELSKGFYDFVGVSISEDDMLRDLTTRPVFNLDDQLHIMERSSVNNDVSSADKYYSALSSFLLDQGVLESDISPVEYVTDWYMTMVSDEPFLRQYAYLGYIEDPKNYK